MRWSSALGAGLAAVAAVLSCRSSQAHYLMGGDPLLLSFIVVIIGGLGSLRGTIVAALLIGLSDGDHLGVLLADAREDPRDARRRPGARLPAAGAFRPEDRVSGRPGGGGASAGWRLPPRARAAAEAGARVSPSPGMARERARRRLAAPRGARRPRLPRAVLPAYHATNLARIMVLAVFAMGYNIAFGYTGLL